MKSVVRIVSSLRHVIIDLAPTEKVIDEQLKTNMLCLIGTDFHLSVACEGLHMVSDHPANKLQNH